jgi:hypothetical protein
MTYEAHREPVPEIGSISVKDAWGRLQEVFERKHNDSTQTVYTGEPGKEVLALLDGVAHGQGAEYDVVVASAHTEAGLHTSAVTTLTCRWGLQNGDESSRVEVEMENGSIVGEIQPGVPKRLAAVLMHTIFRKDLSEAAATRLYPEADVHLPDEALTIAPMLELFPETDDKLAAQISRIRFERFYETRPDRALPPS